jgi:hypothetical protein
MYMKTLRLVVIAFTATILGAMPCTNHVSQKVREKEKRKGRRWHHFLSHLTNLSDRIPGGVKPTGFAMGNACRIVGLIV